MNQPRTCKQKVYHPTCGTEHHFIKKHRTPDYKEETEYFKRNPTRREEIPDQ